MLLALSLYLLVMVYLIVARVENISKKKYEIDNKTLNLLTKEEVNYLSIERGTLTKQEREQINQHTKITYGMLKMTTL
jgi:hypothetical protein